MGILRKNKFNEKELLAVLNLLQNEAHRELFIQGLKNITKKDEKHES